MRIQVEAWSACVVVAEDDLLSRLVLFGYVFGCVALNVEFPAPDKGGLEAGDCMVFIPFRGAEITKEAFTREPEAFAFGERCFAGC